MALNIKNGVFARPATEDPMGESRTIFGTEDDSGAALVMPREKIGKEEIAKATKALRKYKDGKQNLEDRIVKDEQWYQLRHWEAMRSNNQGEGQLRPEPASAWLFNSIMNKHADAVDNYPEPKVLPREASDKEDADTLSSILPVIMERNGFEKTYSKNWWEKLKHGTAAYGVFWNSELENGLGDIDIKEIDLLNIFWEPGITDIQKSRYLFIVDLWDIEQLDQMYPEHKGKFGTGPIEVKKYVYSDDIDTADKALVIDCYYKVKTPGGATQLHMMKFSGEVLLFASENEEVYQEKGFYAHGKYPVVLDSLFPEKGTPIGFGYVSICKDPQMYIDKLNQNILENAVMSTKVRYMVAGDTAVNEKEFADWSKPIVHVESSSLDDAKIKQITMQPMGGIYADVLQMKINELKETSGNRDVNSGGAGSGVTAAAAIAALQEAGNKNSRDMISTSYSNYTEITALAIELIRQFYDEMRTFRITGKMPGQFEFVSYSNAGLQDQLMAPAYVGAELEEDFVPSYRRPVFDIKIRAEKRNPFSQMALNETAKELYAMGAFNPERATEASIMLDMMEFEGVDTIKEKVAQGQTLMNMMQQMAQQMDQMAALLQMSTGRPANPAPEQSQEQQSGTQKVAADTIGRAAKAAQQTTMTSYGQRLAERAGANMNITSNQATPGR